MEGVHTQPSKIRDTTGSHSGRTVFLRTPFKGGFSEVAEQERGQGIAPAGFFHIACRDDGGRTSKGEESDVAGKYRLDGGGSDDSCGRHSESHA